MNRHYTKRLMSWVGLLCLFMTVIPTWANHTNNFDNPPFMGCSDRVTSGLVALYDFTEGSGTTVNDISGVGSALNLHIQHPNRTQWLSDCGLKINQHTIIRSNANASKITNKIKNTNEITIEAWVMPANNSQSGPARIVTISKNTSNRNTTLGQEGKHYAARYRTSTTGNNGLPT